MDRQLDRFDQRGSHQRGSLIVVMVVGIVWLVAGGGYDCLVETVRRRGRDSETKRER